MRTLLTASALTAIFTIGTVADVMAWERKGSRTGPRGTSTVEASGSCGSGGCSRDITRTGALGKSASRNSELGCAEGSCSGNRTTTLPSGKTVTREGSITR